MDEQGWLVERFEENRAHLRVVARPALVNGAAGGAITVNGRPVGITFAPDGTLFVSDDKDGVIYHVWYKAP